jgi:hypothetical protein
MEAMQCRHTQSLRQCRPPRRDAGGPNGAQPPRPPRRASAPAPPAAVPSADAAAAAAQPPPPAKAPHTRLAADAGLLQSPPLVAVSATPRGRGLVAAAGAPRGALASVPLRNALVIADDPLGAISVFSDRQQRAWQEAHGGMPEALLDFLGGGRAGSGSVRGAWGGRPSRAPRAPLLMPRPARFRCTCRPVRYGSTAAPTPAPRALQARSAGTRA